MRATTIPLVTAVAGASGLGYSWLEARHFALRHFTLAVLPAGAAPLRVLHLSDLHLVPRQRRKRAWLAGLAAVEPDVVVSTGDSLAHRSAVPAVLEAHGELLERPGVFVLGSNDYYEPHLKNPARYFLPNGGRKRMLGVRLPTQDLVQGFVSAGWLDLTNRRGTLEVGGHRLEFIGVDDPHLGLDRYDEVAGPADPAAALTVGVTHAPYRRVLDSMTADGAGLVLAGHTHGGQLCLPGVGALVTNCDLPRRQAKGVSQWPPLHETRGVVEPGARRSTLHVCAGLGTSPFTVVRFACRPEASLLTLTAKQ